MLLKHDQRLVLTEGSCAMPPARWPLGKKRRRFLMVAIAAYGVVAWSSRSVGQIQARSPIDPDEGRPRVGSAQAQQVVGKTAFIHGTVTKVSRRGGVHALEFGNPSSPEFEIIIFKRNASNFPSSLEEKYSGKIVRVRGVVSTYAGVPQIVAASPDQIEILQSLPQEASLEHRTARRTTGPLTFATFNILNLFDNVDDPYRNDDTTPVKPREQLEAAAKAIRELDADVLALEEVENRGYLERFVEVFLPDMGYENVVLQEGNDARGIDVGLLSRVPVGKVTTHRHLMFPGPAGGMQQFSRDLLSVELHPSEARTMEVWVVHLKSNYDGRAHAEPLRVAEANAVRKLLDERLSQDPTAAILLCGDFNDTWESKTLHVVAGDGTTAMRAFVDDIPASERITYNKEPYRSMIDFILSSPELAKYYIPGSYRIHPGSVASIGSDHNPVSAQFSIR